MKKIIYTSNEETNEIYFDFEKDFPVLGCKWIARTNGNPFTDCDAEADVIEDIEKLISKGGEHGVQDANETDLEYVSELIQLWNL